MLSFEDFWPHYVRQHLNPVNRTLHFLGTTLALLALAASVALIGPPRPSPAPSGPRARRPPPPRRRSR